MVEHVGTATKSSRLPELPYHAQCTCGTAGSFPQKEMALQYLTNHGVNVQANNPSNKFRLVDDTDKPEVIPGRPSTHIPGVGTMPTSHAALGTDPAPLATAQTAAQPADTTDWSLPENWKKNRKKNK